MITYKIVFYRYFVNIQAEPFLEWFLGRIRTLADEFKINKDNEVSLDKEMSLDELVNWAEDKSLFLMIKKKGDTLYVGLSNGRV